jgi:hypothetical protein
MTVDALPRDTAKASAAIGAHDANIFLCPRCTRPLAVGVSKCAGCGTRLLAGVPLLKVGGFIGAGLIVGLLVGGGGVGAATLLGRPATGTVGLPPAAVLPSAAPAPASIAPLPSVAPVAPAVPAVPPAALSALRQSTTINQRLLADAELLSQAMAATSPAATDIAPLLRSLAATASFGDRAATTVGTWDDAALVAKDLGAFYASIDRIAGEGLSASLNNARAYRDAGRRMLAVLAGVTDLDAASRGLAATVDVELPPLVPAS